MTDKRNNFIAREQKEKDVFAAIKVITPVVSIISQWGKEDRELLKIKTEINKLQKEIKAIDAVIEIFPNCLISEVLTGEKKIREEAYYQFSKRKSELEKICADLTEEIIEYQEYVKTFSWINEHIVKVLFERVSEDESMNLNAVVFFVDLCFENRKKMLEEFNRCFPDQKGISKALVENKLVKYLKSH